MTERLTIGIRDQIKERLIDHKFDPLRDAMRKEEAELAHSVYNQAFTSKTRDLMATLPNGWLPETSAVSVSFGGPNAYTNLELGANLRVTYSKRERCGALLALDPKSGFANKIADFVSRKQKLKADATMMEREIIALLKSFSTIKQVEENWPEIKPFLKGLRHVTVKLPVPRLEDLNKKLGLQKAA